MEFSLIKNAVHARLEALASDSSIDLFVVDVEKDALWDAYLGSFPEGSNPIYKERTEHDCQCCKQFIRACGGVVADALSELVKSRPIKTLYKHYQTDLGVDHNFGDEGIEWTHFHYALQPRHVMPNADIATFQSEVNSSRQVFARALEEITVESLDIVLDLIGQKSIYKGDEFKNVVMAFRKLKLEYDTLLLDGEQDLFCWVNNSIRLGSITRFRSTVIGTLLVDLSTGVDLVDAVKMYESKTAPQNYKRTSALITQGMIKKAQETIVGLGFEASLHRRFAMATDLTINNVLFADKAVRPSMGGVFDDLMQEAGTVNKQAFDKVEEVGIDTFLAEILPHADSVELMLDNNHVQNLVSLIAPVEAEASTMFRWGNNFSWSYNGEVADSMKEQVKKAGGNVEGVLRFSIRWNDSGENNIDFDAHCHEPKGNHIYYSHKNNRKTGGSLDVDITSPGGNIAVENITWPILSKMEKGEYRFRVKNYSGRMSKGGFTAEIEYNGQVYSFEHNKNLKGGSFVDVATGKLSGNGFELVKSMPNSMSSRDVWGVKTHTFHKVDMIMNSPNHWDGEKTGNKHVFFMLAGCANPEPARGFYNEFLNEELHAHRKVFEVLGSKMKTPESDQQLSGLGFSSTKRATVICKVSGSFARTIKIKF